MKILFLTTLLFIGTGVCAMSWLEGSLVLNNGQVLVGEISVVALHNTVLFRSHDKVDVYPAYKISEVRFYDPSININRKFICIRTTNEMAWSSRLFEVVLSGEVQLIREELSDDVDDSGNHDAAGFRYFVIYKGSLVSLKKFRSKVYPALRHSSVTGLSEYVRRNRLNPNNESNAVKIIDYYNHSARAVINVAMN